MSIDAAGSSASTDTASTDKDERSAPDIPRGGMSSPSEPRQSDGGTTNSGAKGSPGSPGPMSAAPSATSAAACTGGAVPVAERCDGQDNDCDGEFDEGLDSMPCGSSMQGLCRLGTQRCSGGQWDECQGAVEPTEETCDVEMQDENCDGTANEGCECTSGEMKPCGAQGACAAGFQLCDSNNTWSSECTIKPRPEICEGAVDEDCDGQVDNGCECTNGTAEDCSDGGEGVCGPGTRRCASGN